MHKITLLTVAALSTIGLLIGCGPNTEGLYNAQTGAPYKSIELKSNDKAYVNVAGNLIETYYKDNGDNISINLQGGMFVFSKVDKNCLDGRNLGKYCRN